MAWPEVYLALLISHLAGDFLLQTEWQAVNKRGGLRRDPMQRRALLLHGLTYTRRLRSRPDLARERDRRARRRRVRARDHAAAHVIDDGRVLFAWMSRVKHNDEPERWLVAAVDQTFHLVCLLPVALVAATA